MRDVPGRFLEALDRIYDPCCRELGLSIVDMGLVRSATMEGGLAHVELMLTSGWCPFVASLVTETEDALRALPGVRDAHVAVTWEEAWTPERLSDDARAKLRFLPTPRDAKLMTGVRVSSLTPKGVAS